MNASLSTQIRDYYSYVDEKQGAVDITAVSERRVGEQPVRPIRPTTPLRRPRRHHRWIVVAAAAAAVLVLVGGVAWLFRVSGSDRPVATTPPTETPSSYRWSRVPDDKGVLEDTVAFGGGMRDVTVGGPGLVAVGEADDGTAVWTSVDGMTWSRAPHDESVFGGANAIWSVTRGGPGLVAVGGQSGPEHERDEDEAAVWTSVDGIIWFRVPHDEAVFGGEGQQQMMSVTAGGPGLVAVGWDTSGDTPDAAVWTSVDGITWSRVPHDEAVFGGQGEQQMNGVTVGGPGLVAVGSDGFLEFDKGQLTDYDDFTGVAAVWTSVDGLTWSRVPTEEAVFGGAGNQWMNAVTSSGSGLVAVGGDWSSAVHHAAVWTSVDGITRSRVPNHEAVFGGGEHDQLMLSVTPSSSGLVAVGRAWAPSSDPGASVWTSDDGITWSWIGYDQAVFGSEDNSSFLLSDGPVFTEYRQFMSSVTATDSGVVAVGADWSGPSHGAAVWVAVPEG